MIKTRLKIFLGFIILISFLYAGDELPEIKQYTSHPGRDFAAAVSPDGRWLAFVSERSGNLDVWIKELPNGRAFQVTEHPAEDYQPTWSNDGNKIAFVSKRQDADGDIWLIHVDPKSYRLGKGKPVQLTHRLGPDIGPSFSPNDDYLVYTQGSDTLSNLFLLDRKKKKSWQLTFKGGFDADWHPEKEWVLFASFRNSSNGDIFLLKNPRQIKEKPQIISVTHDSLIELKPQWSFSGSQFTFVCWANDTNQDGWLTLRDNASVWIKSVSENEDPVFLFKDEQQLTSYFYQDNFPCFDNEGRVYFSSNRGGGDDIWSIPQNGLVSVEKDAKEFFAKINERFGLSVAPEALYQSNLAYERLVQLFPDDHLWDARALLMIAENQRILGELKACENTLTRILNAYPDREMATAYAQLKLATLKHIPVLQRIALCQSLVDQSYTSQRIVPQAYLILGSLYRQIGNHERSFFAYTQAVEAAGSQQNIKAQALLEIGDYYQKDGQLENAKQYYLSVLREFGDVPLWRQRANQRLLTQVEGSSREKIQGFQDFFIYSTELPETVASAQLEICKILIYEKQYMQALQELEYVEQLVPTEKWAHIESILLQADVYHQMHDDLKAIILLEQISENYTLVEGGRYIQMAQNELINILIESANRIKQQGDHALAAARYQKVIQLDPQNIEAHRGWIESQFYINKINEVIDTYLKLQITRSNDPVVLYCLGLACSFQGEAEKNIEKVKQSNIYLKSALDLNYRMIYPYRTLSYNYEFLEKLTESRKNQPKSFLHRMGHIAASPVRWVGKLIPGADEGDSQYYELAIDALITALEINDENVDPEMESQLSQNLANNFYNLGEFGFKKAFYYYQYRLKLDTTFNHPLARAVFYERAGHAGAVIEDLESTAIYLNLAIDAYTKLRRDRDVVINQRRLAFYYQLTGQYEEAIEIYHILIPFDEEEKKWQSLELDYRNIAYNYHLMGEPEDALHYGKKAEFIFDTQDLPKGEAKRNALTVGIFGLSIPVWTMSEIGGASSEGFTLSDEKSFVYAIISQSHEAVKHFDEAIQYEQKRMALFKKEKDIMAVRIALNRLGQLHFKKGDYLAAWSYFYRSYYNSLKKEDARGRWINAVNLGNVATVLISIHKNDDNLNQTIEILRNEYLKISSASLATNEEQLGLLSNLGNLILYKSQHLESDSLALEQAVALTLFKLDQLELAESYLTKACQIARLERHWEKEGILLKNLAEVSELSGDINYAYQRLQDSYRLFRKHGAQNYLWRIEYDLANLIKRMSVKDIEQNQITLSCLDYYERAMDRLESLPVFEEASEERLSDRKDRIHLYRDAVFAYSEENDFDNALKTLERGRQKHVADMMARHPVQLKKERHKVAMGNIRYLRNRLYDIQNQIYEEEENENRPLVLADLEKQYDRYWLEYAGTLSSIEKEDPVLAYLTGTLSVSLYHFQNYLDDQSTILSYLMGKENSLLFVITKDKVEGIHLDFTQNQLIEILNVLRSSKEESRVDSLQHQLYSKLIEPVKDTIDPFAHLYMIPDQDLWHLSFGHLSDGNDMLYDLVTLSYLPSVTSFALLQDKQKINQHSLFIPASDQRQILAKPLADAYHLQIQKSEKHNLAQEIPKYDLLHLNCQLHFYENNPMLSEIRVKQHDVISVETIFGWDNQSSLIVFDADTSWLSYNAGFELMLYGWFYSGIPSMILTEFELLKPNENAQFWKTFYHDIVSQSYADAFANAQFTLNSTGSKNLLISQARLFGLPGMNQGARRQFAQNNLRSEVIKAQQLEGEQEYLDALRNYDQALNLASAVNRTDAYYSIQQLKLRTAVQGELWPQAIEIQKEILTAYRQNKDESRIETALKNLSVFYTRNHQLTQAAESRLDYIQMLLMQGERKEIAAEYEALAFIYAQNRQYHQADTSIQKALGYYRELMDPLGEAKALIRKGRFELEADQYYNALSDLESGIKLLDTLLNRTNSNQILFEKASAIQLSGLVYEKLTRYDKAIDRQTEARELFRQLQLTAQEAQGAQYLANLYWKSGLYQKALVEQNHAMQTFETLGNQQLLSMAYSTRGLIHMSVGDIEKSEQDQMKALDLAKRLNHQADQATILKNIGLIEIQKNNYEEAYRRFGQAAHLDSIIQLESGLAYDYRNQGMLLIEMSQAEQALPLFQKGLRISKKISDQRNMIQSYYGLGKAYNQLKKYKKAVACLDSGTVLTRNLMLPDIEWRLYHQLGRVHENMGKNQQAYSDYEKAVQLVEGMRSELKVESFKQGFFDNKTDLYIDLITLLIQMKRLDQAFAYTERAKSRSFIDMLGNQDLNLSQQDKAQLQKEKMARDQLQEAQEQLTQLNQQPDPTLPVVAEQIKEWQKKLQKRREAYTSLMVEIQSENAELASFINVDPMEVHEIQQILSDSTLLVEYYLTPDRLYIWQIDRQQLKIHQVDLLEFELIQTIQSFRSTMESYLSVDKLSDQLYQWLLEPIKEELNTHQHLVIVPHGLLHYLPFAALKSQLGAYVIQTHTLSYAPSATVLGYCMEKGDERRQVQGKKNVLALGNPDLGDAVMDLPFAEKEVKSLKRSFLLVDAYLRNQATESVLYKEADKYRLIHFACHGVFEPKAPLFSSLLLTPEDSEDGRLEAHEIFGLKLNCDLVTLSACETGLAHITSGDEIIGLTRSFIYAGTPSMITSLWKVDDLATAVMIKRFYRYYAWGMSRAKALQDAQLLVMRSINPHPAAWAAFSLTGDFR